MQDALKYVSILSLLRYNLVLQKHWKYYYGIIPIMRGKEVATRVYLNIYWLHKGNLEESKEPRLQGGALKPKFLYPKPRSRIKFGMTKRAETNSHVMLNLFQHLVYFFSPFSRRIFHPRPQEGVFRCDFNKEIIKRFEEELKVSSANQVRRLNLVCKNDVFMNAFVNTQLVTQSLINIGEILTKSFSEFERSFQIRL